MQQFPSAKENLTKYVDATFPILYIYTFEESKADSIISSAVGRKEVIEWNGANGLSDFKNKTSKNDVPLETALSSYKGNKDLNKKVLVIKDAADELESKKVVAILKEIARKIRTGFIDSTVIIVSSRLNIPKDLEKFITIMELDMPREAEIHSIIEDYIKNNEDIPDVTPALINEMSLAFKGLSEYEIKELLNLAIATDGELTRKSLSLISNQKKQIILKSGILEMIKVTESIDDIGGLENLKEWLQKKARVFKNIKEAEKFGVPIPKGVLIAGVAGCGKSLTAKAAGALFEVPLLRLDMGRLMGKYVGESEENMRKAIMLAEAISPCILWVDELEKAFAGISGGSEVTVRLFGAFLTWMQEKKAPVFVVATANDITKLPPELMRKGRFDEIFYVSMPNEEERRKIFSIHINKRRKNDASGIDLNSLAKETNGYSGADIECVVGESVENVFVKGAARLTTEDIIGCIKNTSCLYEIMGKQIDSLMENYENNKFKKASR